VLGLGLFYWTDSRQAWHPVTHLHEIRGQRSHPCERQLFRFSFTFVGATCGVLGTWAATTTVGSVGQIRIAWDRASLLQWTSLLRLSRGCRGQQHVKRSIRQRVKWICFERMLRAAKQTYSEGSEPPIVTQTWLVPLHTTRFFRPSWPGRRVSKLYRISGNCHTLSVRHSCAQSARFTTR